VVGLQNILQVVQGKAQAALTDSAVPTVLLMTVQLLTVQLYEQIQALQDTLYSTQPAESCTAWWLM